MHGQQNIKISKSVAVLYKTSETEQKILYKQSMSKNR